MHNRTDRGSKVASRSILISVLAATFIISGFFIVNTVQAAAIAPCSGDVGSVLLVNVTQQVSNDPDSGIHGNWAMDAFTKHIQVWLDVDGTTYCGQTMDSGTFVTNGTVTPENGSSLPQTVNGTLSGGARYTIHGTFLADSSTWHLMGSVPENTCGGDGSACPSGTYSQWVSQYFSGESHSFVNWGWVYTSSLGESWTNADIGDSGDIHAIVNSNTHNGYTTIQDAVNNATAGDTINVVSGTYDESILIDRQVTLTGVGATKPVISGSAVNYIVKLDGVTSGAILDNLEINGGETNSFDYGVLVNNSGTSGTPVEIKNSIIKNVWNNGANAVGVENGSYAYIHNNALTSFHKNGVRIIQSNGHFSYNTVIGESVDGTSRVQNLVNVRGGSNVEVDHNTLTNALTDPLVKPTWDSVGVLVSAYLSPSPFADSQANIHDNEISYSDSGIVVSSFYADPDHSSATISHNNLHNLNWAINFEKSTASAVISGNSFANVNKAVNSDDSDGGPTPKPTINAQYNWWGRASGPIPGLVYASVSFNPWYANDHKTVLGTTTVSVDGSQTSTLATATTAIASTSAGTVSIDIPAGVVVTGPTDWDGTLTLPTVTSTFTLTPDSGNTASAVSAIEVGLGDTHLTLDKAVKLTFVGQAGKFVGWSQLGIFHPITTTCDSPTTPTLASGADCKVDVGTDLIVWTKHFTVFVTFTQAVIPPSSGGGASTPTPTPTPQVKGASTKAVDINQDGKVDIFDFNLLMVNWGGNDTNTDINKDGKVDIFDFNLLMVGWDQ